MDDQFIILGIYTDRKSFSDFEMSGFLLLFIIYDNTNVEYALGCWQDKNKDDKVIIRWDDR